MATGGATLRMAERAGLGNAMLHLLTADEFGSAEALRLNFVQKVVPAGQELDEALAIAQRIAAQAPLAVVATRLNVLKAIEQGPLAAVAGVHRGAAAAGQQRGRGRRRALVRRTAAGALQRALTRGGAHVRRRRDDARPGWRIRGRVRRRISRGCIEQARALGVTGWVRNRSDGSVEATLQGAPQRLDALCEWLRHGVPAARVDEVVVPRCHRRPRFDRFERGPVRHPTLIARNLIAGYNSAMRSTAPPPTTAAPGQPAVLRAVFGLAGHDQALQAAARQARASPIRSTS